MLFSGVLIPNFIQRRLHRTMRATQIVIYTSHDVLFRIVGLLDVHCFQIGFLDLPKEYIDA